MDDLERVLESTVEALGFELVELERAGAKVRPILRLRIDRPGSEPGDGVTVDDCARVSRAVEPLLDERLGGARYVVEVSSPGLERPLVRARDFRRFAGEEVVLKGFGPLADRSRRLEGELLGVRGEEGEERVALRLADGTEVEVARSAIAHAHLVYRWDGR